MRSGEDYARETFFKPLFKGGFTTSVGGANPSAGRTDIASGVVTVTVSTNAINSSSLLLMGTQMASGGLINSAGTVVVNSIVPGVSFAFTTPNAVAAPFNRTVMWMLVNPRG